MRVCWGGYCDVIDVLHVRARLASPTPQHNNNNLWNARNWAILPFHKLPNPQATTPWPSPIAMGYDGGQQTLPLWALLPLCPVVMVEDRRCGSVENAADSDAGGPAAAATTVPHRVWVNTSSMLYVIFVYITCATFIEHFDGFFILCTAELVSRLRVFWQHTWYVLTCDVSTQFLVVYLYPSWALQYQDKLV